jgi:hypothetical protein
MNQRTLIRMINKIPIGTTVAIMIVSMVDKPLLCAWIEMLVLTVSWKTSSLDIVAALNLNLVV